MHTDKYNYFVATYFKADNEDEASSDNVPVLRRVLILVV